MEPAVTVVIPTLDRLSYLGEAVASVRAQAGVPFELVVVDNGSGDGTEAWLREQGLATIRVERDPGRSRAANVSSARNAGLELARGRYVWFLDDDDRLRPGALALLAAALDRHPDAVAAVGARVRFGPGVAGGRIAHPLGRMVRDLGPEVLLSWGFVPGQALCRVSSLRAAGRWREDVPHAEDLELWARLVARGPVALEPQTVLEYRVHRTQSRLADPTALRDELLRPHATELAGGDEARGLRLREAGRRWDRANAEFGRGEYRHALVGTIRAVVLAPTLIRSPILRPLVARLIVRSALRCAGPTRRWVEARVQLPPDARPRRGTGFLS